ILILSGEWSENPSRVFSRGAKLEPGAAAELAAAQCFERIIDIHTGDACIGRPNLHPILEVICSSDENHAGLERPVKAVDLHKPCVLREGNVRVEAGFPDAIEILRSIARVQVSGSKSLWLELTRVILQ